METIKAFDLFLTGKKLRFEGVLIGGAALNLLGIVSRETRDCDVLDPMIPKEISAAASEFGKHHSTLGPEWLNNGPDSLKKNLPKGWANRTRVLFQGTAILFHTLAREDLIKTKLFAFCDRDIDLPDCLALKPTKDELLEAKGWVQHQDTNPRWPAHVNAKITELAERLGYEF